MSGEIGRAVEEAVRQSYGRLVALLSRHTRDLASAEDALSDALKTALEVWPATGIPSRPEAWLLTTARRRILDRYRHARVVESATVSLLALAERTEEQLATLHRIPDHRLELMFACCHPAVDAEIRTPLMLQTVLGIDAAAIASAFLVAPSTMGQRLSRAKARIKQAGISFELPERREMEERLDAVLSSVYVAFSLDLDAPPGHGPSGEGFAREAVHLASLLAELLPEEPEVLGLAALVLHIHARREARVGPGGYVPLDEQDPSTWDGEMIARAEDLLARAGRLNSMGRFQLEAAIQSVHAGRAVSGRTDWEIIAQLYEGLIANWPSVGAWVGRAIAISHVRGTEQALGSLDALTAETVVTYQPYWAARAELLFRAGRTKEAVAACDRAIGLTRSPVVRAYLTDRRQGARGRE